MGSLRDWLSQRFPALPSIYNALLREPIPHQPSWWYFGLGGTILFLLIVQVFTGILLALYYKPTPEEAYGSTLLIMSDVRFGWLVRSIHSYAGQLMVVAVLLHMIRVLVAGSYKSPRELTWVIGVLLFLVTLGFAFTGYLLPWDQRSYWATTVGTEMAGAVPLIGQPILEFLRGGAEVTDLTLTRFFASHTMILPLVTVLLIGLHIFLVRLQGVSPPPED